MGLSINPVIISVSVVFLTLLLISISYKRASKKIAYVCSGHGGERLLLNQSAFVFPVIHRTIPVNLTAQCLNISNKEATALLTKDFLKLDLSVDFYVQVPADTESIMKAAQTMGKKTNRPYALKKFLHGKLVGALREVSATMTLTEIFQNQRDFVDKVQRLLTNELKNYCLQLESIAIESIQPTSISHYHDGNQVDAKGKTRLADEIAQERKKQTEIDLLINQETKEKELDCERLLIEIEQKKQIMRFEQGKQISLCQAAIESDVAKNAIRVHQAQHQAERQAQHVLDLENQAYETELDEIKQELENADTERQQAKTIELQTRLNEAEIAHKRRLNELEIIQIKEIAKAEKQAAEIFAEAEHIRSTSKVKTSERLNKAEREKFKIESEGINEISAAIHALTESGFPERLQDNLVAVISGLVNSRNDPVLRPVITDNNSFDSVTEFKNSKDTDTNLKRDKLQALLKEANHPLAQETLAKADAHKSYHEVKDMPSNLDIMGL